MSGTVPRWGLALVAGVMCLMGGGPADGRGRVPYGGQLRVTVMGYELDGWRRSLSDCYLFRDVLGASPTPELARDLGRVERGRLVVRLVGGASFHDGSPVAAQQVVAMVRNLARGGSAQKRSFALLDVKTEGPLVVSVKGPRGMSTESIRRLLAHPDAAIRRSGSRCGPFVSGGVIASTERFEAHEGHPRGRPWLDTVELTSAASPERAVEALVFGESDATTVPSSRNRRVSTPSPGGWGTVFAVPGTHWRGEQGNAKRRRAAQLLGKARFGPYLDRPVAAANSFFPPAYGVVDERGRSRAEALELTELTVAYPAERSDLADLARAVRDTLRVDGVEGARVEPVDGLDVAQAIAGTSAWDLALVEVDWTSRDAAQAMVEASARLGIRTPAMADVIKGAVGSWLVSRHKHLEVIPVVHVARSLFHRHEWHVTVGSGGVGGLAWSWRRP